MTIQFRLQPESNTDEPHLNNNQTLHYISLYRTYNHDKKNSDNLKRNYEKKQDTANLQSKFSTAKLLFERYKNK